MTSSGTPARDARSTGARSPAPAGHSAVDAGRARRTVQERTRRRDIAALKLRSMGLAYSLIAERMGYSDGSAARKAAIRELSRISGEPMAEARILELSRLDELHRRTWEILDSSTDSKVALSAIDRALAIGVRRAKLLGLDAAQLSERLVRVDRDISDSVMTARMDAEIEKLNAELAAMPPSGSKLDDKDLSDWTDPPPKDTRGGRP